MRRQTPTRAVKRLLTVAAGGVLIAFAAATPAWGHAVLLETTPIDGAQLVESPTAIRLVFSEPVDLPVAALRVFDSSGMRVDEGAAAHGASAEEVSVTVPELAVGSYIVTWRAVSADGHPVRGAFVFQVGQGAVGVDETFVAALLGESRYVPFATAAWLLRWLTYGGVLVAAGAMCFLLLVAREPMPIVTDLIRRAALVGIVGSVLQVPVFAAEATGLGMGAFVSIPALAGASTSSVALAGVVRIAALSTLWASAASPVGWRPVAGVAGVVLAELLTGHTRTLEPAWLILGADAVHVLGAAVWFGGLAALALSLRPGVVNPVRAARIVARFSNLAVWSLLALSLAGLALAWVGVQAFHALTSTAYGWTLLGKVGLVMLVVAVAAYNNRVLVPAVAALAAQPAAIGGGSTEAPAVPRLPALDRLSRTVRAELAGLVVVLAATALLVNLQPAAEAAGVSGPYSTFVAFGDLQLNLVVDPNRAGLNEIHLYVLTSGGLPALVTGEAEIQLSLPAEDIGPIVRPLQVAGPGHYVHIGPELAIVGEWMITVRQRVSQFEERAVEVPIKVNR